MIPALTDPPSTMTRVDYWIAQLTGTPPANDLAAFFFHVNGLAAAACQLGISDEHVHIHVTNALAAADCAGAK